MNTSLQDNYQKDERPYKDEVINAYTVPEGGPSKGGMIKPKSHMAVSIVVTVISTICCYNPVSLVLGIIAIVKASKVDSDFFSENVHDAIQNSESAKKFSLWAAIIAVAGFIAYIIINFWIFKGSFYEGFIEDIRQVMQQYQ
jgi:hypothetical protein